MIVHARYTGANTQRFTTGLVYKVMDDDGSTFITVDNYGEARVMHWGSGLFEPGTNERRKWYVVPDYQPNGTPATTAHVVDAAGQEVATFERIADAEAAVAAVNNATGEWHE